MSKRKTIIDLKPRDIVYTVSNTGYISKRIIESVSVDFIYTEDKDITIRYNEEDFTCWKIKATGKYSSSHFDVYLNMVDALKERKKILELELEGVFEKQQDFLKLVKKVNDLIFECNKEIIDQLK